MKRIKVCLVSEGSYPFITGGVSSWVQDLIRNIPEVDFTLFTISPSADQELRYDLPENVVDHVDIVLTENTVKPKRITHEKELFKEVQQAHGSMYKGGSPSFESMIRYIPEGANLSEIAAKHPKGWQMITHANQQKNPVYPFSDYFWAWKSAHEMLFRVLAGTPPESDIFHAVSTGFAGLGAMAAQIRRKKPFILTEHGLYHKEREIEIRKSSYVRGYQRDMWTKLYNKVSEVCYKSADVVTALFEENRRKQMELGAPAHRCRVIPNGIDVARYSSVQRIKKQGFHIGLVGRVVPIKDIKTFISCCKVISQHIPEALFYCIGPTDEDPDYYEDCMKLVKSLRIEDRFFFTGRQNVLEYYAYLDVMLLTSIREAQPLVILEAWSAGVPVVATKVGNVAEMLDYDERFLSPSKDPDTLARGSSTFTITRILSRKLSRGIK
jgi:glycosyltransferase involved in cell wall biosynthesis